MTRRDTRKRSSGQRRALRAEFARRVEVLHFLRLFAGASPELAGFAFMCDGAVETNRSDRELVVRTDAAPRTQHLESAGRALFDLPAAEAHIVRLPLVPTRPLAREREPTRS
jgi:hypothetical protein